MENDVRGLRLAVGASQRELAEALGVSRQTVNSIGLGARVPMMLTLLLVAQVAVLGAAFGVLSRRT